MKILISLAAIICVGCATGGSLRISSSERAPSSGSARLPAEITLIGLTDFHGALVPDVTATVEGRQVRFGGAATLASYVKILRKKMGGVVALIDAGDLFQGTMESNLFEGAPVVRFYNQMGVTATALGNHEFDFGPAGDKAIPRDPSDDPRGALKARISEAHFPILAVNVVDENGSTPSWLKRSIVVEDSRVRIGIIGAATPSTVSTTNGANLVGLKFLDWLEPAIQEAKRLRSEERADVVLLTIHEGGGCKDNDDQDDASSCEKSGILEAVARMPEGLIDAVVAGHTHKGIAKRVGRTVVVQPFSKGKYISWMSIPVRDPGRRPSISGMVPVCETVLKTDQGPVCTPEKVKGKKGEVVAAEFLGERVVPDAEVAAILAPDLEKVRALKEEKLGIQATGLITRSYAGESGLGNLVADALADGIQGADIGVTNGGGLRENLPPGPVTYGRIFEVLPFDNQLAAIRVDGKTVRKIVGLGHSGSHGGLTWSNLTFKAKDCEVGEILFKGEPLDDDRIYKLATSDYLATGGSGFDSLHLKPEQIEIFWDRPDIMREAVVRVLRSWKRDLDPAAFYSPTNKRQLVEGTCHADAH